MALTQVRPEGLGFVNGKRNLIINGAMQVAQRGTSSTLSGYHSVDRFSVDFVDFDQLGVTHSQSTTVPSGKGFSNSLKVEVTTQETTLNTNELFIIRQKIEAQNLQHLAYGTSSAKSLTLSFWVRSSLAGKYSILFYAADGLRTNLQSFTISSSDTWEFVTITIDGDTAGTINNDNGAALQVTWVLAAGTDWTGTPHTGWGAYDATDDYAFSDQVNFAAQTGDFYITGVQLEVGTNASDFEYESFAETLQKCQRYYQKSFHYVTPPGSATPSNHELQFSFGTATSLIAGAFVVLPVQLRANPTITFYDNAGTSGKVSKFSGGGGRTDNITLNVARGLENRINVRIYASSAAGVGFMYQVDAEL